MSKKPKVESQKPKVQVQKARVQQPDIAGSVMKELGRKNIKMHSHWYFVLLSALTLSALLASTIIAIYLVHVTAYSLRSQRAFDYLGFGGSGVGQFIQVFPWGWLALALASIAAVLVMLRRYDFAHKHNFYGVLAGAGISLVLVGCVLAITGLRPPGSNLEKRPPHSAGERQESNRIVGNVVEIGEEKVVVEEQGRTVDVRVDKHTLIRGRLAVGQHVVVLGRWDGDEFKARAISTGKVIGPEPAPASPRR